MYPLPTLTALSTDIDKTAVKEGVEKETEESGRREGCVSIHKKQPQKTREQNKADQPKTELKAEADRTLGRRIKHSEQITYRLKHAISYMKCSLFMVNSTSV